MSFNRTTPFERVVTVAVIMVILLVGLIGIAIPTYNNYKNEHNSKPVNNTLALTVEAVNRWEDVTPGNYREEITLDTLVEEHGLVIPEDIIVDVNGTGEVHCVSVYATKGSSFSDMETAATYDSIAGGFGKRGMACSGETPIEYLW